MMTTIVRAELAVEEQKPVTFVRSCPLPLLKPPVRFSFVVLAPLLWYFFQLCPQQNIWGVPIVSFNQWEATKFIPLWERATCGFRSCSRLGLLSGSEMLGNFLPHLQPETLSKNAKAMQYAWKMSCWCRQGIGLLSLHNMKVFIFKGSEAG